MKHFLLALSATFVIAVNAKAQTNNKTHFMLVSIHAGVNAHQPEVIVTREDGPQQITKAVRKSWMWEATTFDVRDGKIEENEDSLFQILKPYFDAGWQLASSTIIRNVQSADDYIARYYFTRKDD
jgi:hypothetical protein